MAEDNEDIGDLVEEEPTAIVLEENDTVDVDETEVTIWAPEPKGSDEVLQSSIEEWIMDVEFESTEDVPIPKRLVDQVIGQEAGSLIIKKAAEQRRHMLMIGDPGTGKSMLARSMTDLLPADSLEDILVYPNEEDENEPRVRSVPAGRGDRIIKVQKEAIRQQKAKSQKVLLLAFGLIGLLLFFAALQSGDIMTLLFGGFLLAFGYMFIRSRLGSVDESRIPKLLVKHEQGEDPPFIDATATLAGSLLGDVRHDPFQSGGMETSAHDRVEPGAIHRANKGVLYIDEVNLLRLEEQQALLTAMQERAFSISGRSERSSGALTKTEPVPCDFILIAAGNLDAIQGMHPALRSRIRGYGYEVYVNSEMPDTARNRRRLIRFIAQEVLRDIDTSREIPHFDKSGVGIILREAQRRSGRRGKLSLRLRELGGLVRIAGDLAMEENAPLTTAKHVLKAREIAKPLEQQVADRMIERRLDYSQIVSTGERVGRVNGLAVLGANSGLSDFSGIMLPVEALVTPSHGGGGKIHATGGLSDLAKESVTNVSAVIKKLTGKDVSDYDIHVQFVNTHGVDGDSASITIATAVISALENIPIRQDLAMTGSLSVRGEVLPIGGVTAKIEAAARCGIKTVVIPRANLQDVLLDDKYEDMINVIAVDTLDEVMLHALVKHSDKASLVERLEAVIDRLTPAAASISPA
ncbi:ATP-dependent protease LonB [Candidatus Poseidoniaceae archaeon]|mgnify:FL=1|nr:ATP-dependent protease LonB [Candidatus Poseidoniaceae archaeon]